MPKVFRVEDMPEADQKAIYLKTMELEKAVQDAVFDIVKQYDLGIVAYAFSKISASFAAASVVETRGAYTKELFLKNSGMLFDAMIAELSKQMDEATGPVEGSA